VFKLFKDSFKLTNDCIILATPLIIFLSIIGWYFNYADYAANDLTKKIMASVTLFVMICGFLASWLYMAKKTIALSKKIFVFDKDRINALINLVLTLPKGVGRLFFPFIGVSLSYVILFILIKFIADFVNSALYPKTDFSDMIITGSLAIVMFLTLFWIPEIVYAKKNFIVSLKNSFIKLLMKFKDSVVLFIYIFCLILSLIVINSFLLYHPYLSFFILMLFYYLLVYVVVLLFTYYERNFIEE